MNEYFLALSKNAPFVIGAVLGLGTLYGKLGAAGRLQLGLSFISGAAIGGAFQVATVGLPGDFAGWFYVGLSSILMGLAPSGVYEAVKAASKLPTSQPG